VGDSLTNPSRLLVGQLQRLVTLGMTFGTLADPVALMDEVVDDQSTLSAPTRAVVRELPQDPRFSRALALANQAHQLASLGEHEARTCLAVLRAFGSLPATKSPRAPDLAHERQLHEALASDIPESADRAQSHARLLESIVASAAQTIGARYGSLFLIDEDTQELVFEVSLRERLEELRRFRLPLGRGIAGLVAMSGQPIAVSDVPGDPRHAADIAEQTGYTPKNLLCVPLQAGDRVIGVLELLDKTGDDSFSIGDMQVLGSFADRAAKTIEESVLHQGVLRLIRRGLRNLAEQATRPTTSPPDSDWELASSPADDPAYRFHIEVGRLVLDVVERDQQVADACGAVLRSVADYARAKLNDSAGISQ
jgi:putative methionine-R-sulfoxide reductase with GAF domain